MDGAARPATSGHGERREAVRVNEMIRPAYIRRRAAPPIARSGLLVCDPAVDQGRQGFHVASTKRSTEVCRSALVIPARVSRRLKPARQPHRRSRLRVPSSEEGPPAPHYAADCESGQLRGTRTTGKPSGSARVTPCRRQYGFAGSTGSAPTRSHASETASSLPR
jgi:hypothetical protein